MKHLVMLLALLSLNAFSGEMSHSEDCWRTKDELRSDSSNKNSKSFIGNSDVKSEESETTTVGL